MRDPRLDRLARVLVEYSAPVRQGDVVTIVGEPWCMPAVEALYEAVLRAGGHPSFHIRSERFQEILLRHGSEAQLRHVCPIEAFRLERCDVLIVLVCHRNTRFLGRIDPARAAIMQAARRELVTMSLRRLAEKSTRYVLTEIPGDAAAQDADMSLTDYEDFVFRAGFLDRDDPVAAWRRLDQQHQTAIRFLSGKRALRFRSPPGTDPAGRTHDGTDVTVEVAGQTWISCAGDQNFPDGEVFTGPRDGGVDGVVNFNMPAVYKGKEVDGIRLRYRAGRVVEASATKNEDYLVRLLDQDEGARVAAEVAMGTNYAITTPMRNAFFDEKLGGSFHIAVGAGYPQSGNANQSGLHWDMVCDLRAGGTIEADGEVIQRDGRFLLPGWPGN